MCGSNKKLYPTIGGNTYACDLQHIFRQTGNKLKYIYIYVYISALMYASRSDNNNAARAAHGNWNWRACAKATCCASVHLIHIKNVSTFCCHKMIANKFCNHCKQARLCVTHFACMYVCTYIDVCAKQKSVLGRVVVLKSMGVTLTGSRCGSLKLQ